MTKGINIIYVLAIITILFSSCSKENGPQIDLEELGYENTATGYLGSDFHIEAEIIAENKIDRVIIEIHPECCGSWEFDTTYTKFDGLKNTEFHEHFELPVALSDTGEYHFHLEVIDMEGNTASVERDIVIKKPDDSMAPVITISSVPGPGQVFSNGQTISISGQVSDDQALGGMYIGLVRADQNLDDSQVNDSNTITLLHTHDFDTSKQHNFSASIEVGAAKDNNISPKDITGDIAWISGDYYILVKCKDAFGGNWAFSTRYLIDINY